MSLKVNGNYVRVEDFNSAILNIEGNIREYEKDEPSSVRDDQLKAWRTLHNKLIEAKAAIFGAEV